ncbi:helix-turn-helix transcriptional regulator [Acidiferrobacter sp.]|uniref:helix-turn-helix domain-containing protein n=1 Tax=Acidiferrobacter sp. TaxID=1872107 RepID=UPI00260E10E9|nr:helix-turn-helix transcriptional regulator [Acidiferrobacter sp.]
MMIPTPEREYLAANLKRARHARGLTQDDIAAMSGVNRAYVSELERARRNIGIDCIGRIAAALDVPAASLLLPTETVRRPRGRLI